MTVAPRFSAGKTGHQSGHVAERRVASVEQKAFVEPDVVPFEEGAVFVGEGAGAMVFRLVADVGADRIQLRVADGKGAVSILPGEGGEIGKGVFDPMGRAAFDELHGF